MRKIRVHELAKELGLSPKEMETLLKDWGYNIKTYSSSLEEHDVNEIRLRLREEKGLEGTTAPAASVQIVRRRPSVVRLRKVSIEADSDADAGVPVLEVSGHEDTEVSMPSAGKEPDVLDASDKTHGRRKRKPSPATQSAKIIARPEPAPESVMADAAVSEIVAEAQPSIEVATERADVVSVETAAPLKEEKTGEEMPVDVLPDVSVAPLEVALETVLADVQDDSKKQVSDTIAPPVKVAEPEHKSLEKGKTEVFTADWSKKGGKETGKGKGLQKGQPAREPKSFVKILDRPRIILPSIQPPGAKQARPHGAPGGHTSHQQPRGSGGGGAPYSRTQETFKPRQPTSGGDVATPAAPFIPDADRKIKKVTKDKRVVQVSEMEEAAKRKKAAKKSEKMRPITKLLTEELEPDILETPDEEVPAVTVKPVHGKVYGGQKKKGQKPMVKQVEPVQLPKLAKKKLTIFETIQVGELSHKMGVKVGEVITKLMKMGVMATVNQPLDFDTTSIIASEFGYEVEKKQAIEEQLLAEEVKTGEQVLRPPVVTVMGHVDHGKTSLLDAIRDTDVVAREAGGITQHIGAYHVRLASGHEVVFLDTPGHAAFTAMRARGAKVTDIVILVVAADDGVMAQTREAIDHSKAAGVPIIVAVNKIDKPEANPDRVKRELADLGLIPEEWGGSTIFVSISAKKRIGIEELVEMLALQADVMELKADPVRPAKGYVIEAKLDKGRGPLATLLVADGTIKPGDAVVCGLHYGKVRAMINDKGVQVQSAGPSMPVEILGLSGVPDAGNEFMVVSDEKKARELAEYRQRKQRELELVSQKKMDLADVFERIREHELKELNIILKTDVQGSLEALSESLRKLSTAEVRVNIAGGGIGAINESDILLASTTNAIVIGFNVKPNNQARALAEHEKIDIRFYDIIYNALDEVRAAMTGLLEPVFKEKELGRAEVRETFHIPKVGTVAGCGVIEGVIQRNALVRVLRDNVVVYTGKLASLRRFKDDVKEVQHGYECGMGLERFNDIKVGDVIEAYVMEETVATLGEVKEAS